MTYRDPRCVMVADSIEEADMVASFLGERDIQAEVMNRNTRGGFDGLSVFARNGVSIHGIEVWVLDPAQVPQAIEILAEQEMLRTTRKAAREATGEPIAVLCEDCGTTTTFPSEMAGTVQDCPNCAAYLDVGEEDPEPNADASEEQQSPDGIQRPSHLLRPESDE